MVGRSLPQHADNGVRLVVHANVLSDDLRIAAEAVLPQPVSQDDDAVLPGSALFLAKRTAERERMAVAEHGEKAWRRDAGRNVLGPIRGREVDAAAAPGVDVGEGRCLTLPFREAFRRRACALALLIFPDHDEAVGFVVRQRRQEETVDNAEDGRRCGDAERQGQDGDRREAGMPAKEPKAEPRVAKDGRHGRCVTEFPQAGTAPISPERTYTRTNGHPAS